MVARSKLECNHVSACESEINPDQYGNLICEECGQVWIKIGDSYAAVRLEMTKDELRKIYPDADK